jgi:hypothetical protein
MRRSGVVYAVAAWSIWGQRPFSSDLAHVAARSDTEERTSYGQTNSMRSPYRRCRRHDAGGRANADARRASRGASQARGRRQGAGRRRRRGQAGGCRRLEQPGRSRHADLCAPRRLEHHLSGGRTDQSSADRGPGRRRTAAPRAGAFEPGSDLCAARTVRVPGERLDLERAHDAGGLHRRSRRGAVGRARLEAVHPGRETRRLPDRLAQPPRQHGLPGATARRRQRHPHGERQSRRPPAPLGAAVVQSGRLPHSCRA